MGTGTVWAEDKIYQLPIVASSLTDLGNLPEIRTPEPFVARWKRMHTVPAQTMHEDSLSRTSVQFVSPWDFRFPSSSARESRYDHESGAVDILRMFRGARGSDYDGGVWKDVDIRKRELPPPPFMGVGYAEETGGNRLEVCSGPEVRGLVRKW